TATTNSISFTTIAAGFQNQGLFFGGADYAYANAANSYVRAPVYGTDATFTTVAGGSNILTVAATNYQTTAAIAAQNTISINTLKVSSASAADVALATGQTLTLAAGGILRTGGSTTTISGGTGISTSVELVIRTDLAADAITINSPILAATNLTKTGAGTLTIGSGTNTFTGSIFINQGVFAFSTSYNGIDTNTSLGASGARNIYLNGGTFKNASGVTFNPAATTKAINVQAAGGTIDLNGQQFQLDDASQLTGAGNLTFINSGSANTVLLGTSAVSYTGFTGNMFVNGTGITLKLVGANAAGANGNNIVMGSNAALDLQATINNNVVIGGTGIAGAGAIISSATGGGQASGYTLTLTSNTKLGNASNLTFSGNIVDNGAGYSLTLAGAGGVYLNGTNNYSGGTIVSAGTLWLGNNSALGTGTLTLNGGSSIYTNGAPSRVLTNNVVINNDISLGQASYNNGSLTFGTLDLGAAARTITVNNIAANPMAFNGAVTNGSGLTVKGFGALYLGGANTFTGTATVNEGGILGVGVGGLNGITALSVGTTFTSGFNLFADSTGGTVSLPSNATVTLGGTKSFARLGFQLGAAGATSDTLALTGASSVMTVGAGGAVISVSPLGSFIPAASSTTTYNLITTASGASISGAAGITL
ncbi:MAG: hypothetical protein EBR83_09465, partial [Verrucomicrobia bacterium]|nr:hypothetical protein [Verrucomicrobiota bacterium]